jgi:hypothetical protein
MFFFPFAFLLFLVAVFSLARLGRRFFQRFFRGVEGEERLEEGSRGRFLRWLPAERQGTSVRKAPDPEARVFRLAYKRKGRLTISDAVVDLGLSIRQAEELLNSLVDGLRVRMEVTPNGLEVYEFPEIIARFGRF